MANFFKNYVSNFVRSVKRLCRYITRYQGVFKAALATVITSPGDLATVNAMIDAIVAGCAVLDKYYPNIPA